MKNTISIIIVSFITVLFACNNAPRNPTTSSVSNNQKSNTINMKLDTITLGGGCFWCVEAIYQRLIGVQKVVSGYAGGKNENPTYDQVCSGLTGHAEVCQITFDSDSISLEEILHVFFSVHDPTTLNRQGNDVGTQYRSVIFTKNSEQEAVAKKVIQELELSKSFSNPIVTILEPYTVFYSAEAYHQNYYNSNTNQGYCRAVITPKVEKFEKTWKEKIRH